MPVDFLKHGHDNPDAVEALYDNDPTLARTSVSDPQHICNVLSEEELQAASSGSRKKLQIVSVARQTSSRRR